MTLCAISTFTYSPLWLKGSDRMHMSNAEIMTPSIDSSVIITPEQFAQAVTKKSADWMHYHNQLHQEIDQLQQENDQLHQKLDVQQNDLVIALVRAQTLEGLLEKSQRWTSQPARSTKLSDSDKFSGMRMELKYFITQLQLKIQANTDHYPTNHAKLEYAISQLKEIALKQVTLRLQGDDIQFENMTELYTFLQNVFDDPNHAETARQELKILWQQNRDFAEFIAKFNCIVSDIKLNEVAIKFALQEEINMKLRNLMIHHSVLKKLEDNIKLLQDLDFHLCALNTHKSIFSRSFLKPTTFFSASSTQSSYFSFKPSYSPITSSSASSVSFSESASSFDPTPMNLSNARRTSLTAEKKTRRV